MFLDEATITVQGGPGGRGCVSWRREKYVPMGGPDGGDGGNGGSVILIADPNTDTLSDFAAKKKFAAKRGEYGRGQNKMGKAGDDVFLSVPPGTIISDPQTKEIIADLTYVHDQYLIARGGRGGYGNHHFKSSTRQRPDFAELGEPGESKIVHLELKLVADVGIIGYPNVGKSTLISVISSAKPKIANYEFTTLVPNLGVVTAHDRSYVVCDIPGLIEGASEGKGLGDQFLKHIERCGFLIHILDVGRALKDGGGIDADKMIADYRAIRKELEAYSPSLSKKKELVVLNKVDLVPDEIAATEKALKKEGIEVFKSISAATTKGTDELKKELLPMVLELREKAAEPKNEKEELPERKPHEEGDKMGAYRIVKLKDGTLNIQGKRLEQFTSMTNFASEGAVQRFRDVLDRTGISKAIKREREGDAKVFIGKVQVEEYL